MPNPSFTDIIRDYLESQFSGGGGGGGGGDITVDSELSTTSTNPVQNRIITAALALKAALTDIPTKVSQLQNDSGFQTASQVQTAITAAVPTKVSDLTNDSGFQTASQVQNAIAQIPDELPSVSASDNGKFLRVVNGIWQASTVPSAEGASF